MNVKEQIKRELQVDFELNVNKDGLVLWEALDYHFETVLTKAQVLWVNGMNTMTRLNLSRQIAILYCS